MTNNIRASASLVSRDVEINRFQFSLTQSAKTNCKQQGISYIAGGSIHWDDHFGKSGII